MLNLPEWKSKIHPFLGVYFGYSQVKIKKLLLIKEPIVKAYDISILYSNVAGIKVSGESLPPGAPYNDPLAQFLDFTEDKNSGLFTGIITLEMASILNRFIVNVANVKIEFKDVPVSV